MANRLWDPDRQLVFELLKQMRKEKSWTQVQLSKALGKPQSYVAKYENGERKVDFVEVAEICACLDSNIVDFSKKFLERIC